MEPNQMKIFRLAPTNDGSGKPWAIGADWDSATALGDYYDGVISEIIFIDNTLTEDESIKIRHYLAKKWGIEGTVDSDRDGIVDAYDGQPMVAATSVPDFSDSVDAQINSSSGLDLIEPNLELWFDASNIDTAGNSTITNGDIISLWNDLSGNSYHASQDTSSYSPYFKVVITHWYLMAPMITSQLKINFTHTKELITLTFLLS